MSRTRPFAYALSLALPLAACVVPMLATTTARADEPPAAQAPRTTFTGTFQRYLLMPNGRPMGLMLSDGTFVFTPGHTLRKDAPALTTGTKLAIDGIARRTPTGTIVQRAIVKLDGNVIADASHGRERHERGERGEERHGNHHALTPQTGAGQIAAIVSGPRGRVRALVLTDGTTVAAQGVEGFGLKIGDRVAVAGPGGVYPRGKALRVARITLPNGQTRDVPKPERHGRDRGPGPA